MNAPCDDIDEEILQDKSTCLPSSKGNGSMVQDLIVKQFKPTKLSLLNLQKIQPERTTSKSCIESLSVINEEIIASREIYTVYWYDRQIDFKYDIRIQASSNTYVSEFIQMVVQEFNNQNQFLQTQLLSDGSMKYELYMSKKSGKPDEDAPLWAGSVQLRNTNVKIFALKVIHLSNTSSPLDNKPINYSITTEPTETSVIHLHWWQKIMSVCCFSKEDP